METPAALQSGSAAPFKGLDFFCLFIFNHNMKRGAEKQLSKDDGDDIEQEVCVLDIVWPWLFCHLHNEL
jgi:hypothetical protein